MARPTSKYLDVGDRDTDTADDSKLSEGLNVFKVEYHNK